MHTKNDVHAAAETTMTPKQLEVWQLHHNHGMSFRSIAIHLDLARTTVTDRYDAACKRLRAAGYKVTPDGTHYTNGDKP